MNKAAQALGRLNKGRKKILSETEKQRRRDALALARTHRHKKKGDAQ
jgi:hypothetical protein